MEGHIEIIFSALDAERNAMLIARLSDAGYEGFWEEQDCLKAYIPASIFEEKWLQEFVEEFAVSYQKNHIEPINWNAVWEAGFDPVQVEDFVSIRAFFHPAAEGVEHDILITPKMSFGTGHHATTRMMVQLMRNMDWANKSVFDFGTGTGVLAILSKKLGASNILAVDNDSWSVENAKENATANDCHSIQILNDDKPPQTGSFDFVLANINKSILLRFLSPLEKLMAPEGKLLLSGLLLEDEQDIVYAANNCNLQVLEKQEHQGWIALKLSKIK